MKDKIRLKHLNRTVLVLLFAVLTGLALSSCKKLDFTKTEINIPADTWLYYDNGTNFTSINANSGGNFDIAIRFSKEQIDSYQGFLISKVTFFPVEGYPAAYSIELWEGGDSPTLVHMQDVSSVTSGAWNTVYIDQSVYVDNSKDLWVGVWIQNYTAGTYPAGCDSGPAVAGKGDLYSIDNGVSWKSLYTSDGLNYNWNIEVYLTNSSGQKVMLTKTDQAHENN
jgi:hypothetical protein